MYQIPRSPESAGALQSLSQESKENIAKIKAAAPKIKTVCDESLVLLGAPIMQESMARILLGKLEDPKRRGERLHLIDAHDALFHLKPGRHF